MSDCPYAGNTWLMSLRCKFEPRYDLIPPDNLRKVWGYNIPDMVEALTKRVYVNDVCVKCGKTTERKHP